MSSVKVILKRALKHGFDLTSIPDYNPKKFKNGLFDHLVSMHFIVYEDDGALLVGYDVFEEIAEVRIDDTTMKIKPLTETGFFEILLELFRYVGIAAEIKNSEEIKSPAEATTEDLDSESSEELWL
tara:strand:+ start:10384 stop:10761 length:378 start_codon:yes stop_codon:yes gene_type:complete